MCIVYVWDMIQMHYAYFWYLLAYLKLCRAEFCPWIQRLFSIPGMRGRRAATKSGMGLGGGISRGGILKVFSGGRSVYIPRSLAQSRAHTPTLPLPLPAITIVPFK